MEESIVYQNDYYESIEVSSVSYRKTSDISKEEYDAYQFQNTDRNDVTYNISSGELGVATYHWRMVPNAKGKEEGVAEIDDDFTKTLTLLCIENEYYVYLTVH